MSCGGKARLISYLTAITIASVSATTVNSPDDIITIFASASGLTTANQYLQAAFTKLGEATDYLGFTQNLSGEWYQYKSSPTSNDLTGFYPLTASNGAWLGNVNTKIDPNDSGFKGAGSYLLKLIKHTGSSYAYSDPVTININWSPATVAAATSNQTATDTPVASPVIDFNPAASANLGEAFRVSVSLQNFAANQNFYVKIRGAIRNDTWTKMQTKNGASFLADNESWANFPQMTTDGSGNWSGEVWGLVTDDKSDGAYQIKLRVRKKDTDSFWESGVKNINLIKVLTPAVLATSSAKSDNLDINSVLGTRSASLSPFLRATPSALATSSGTSHLAFDPFALILLLAGGGLSAGSIGWYLFVLKSKHG